MAARTEDDHGQGDLFRRTQTLHRHLMTTAPPSLSRGRAFWAVINSPLQFKKLQQQRPATQRYQTRNLRRTTYSQPAQPTKTAPNPAAKPLRPIVRYGSFQPIL